MHISLMASVLVLMEADCALRQEAVIKKEDEKTSAKQPQKKPASLPVKSPAKKPSQIPLKPAAKKPSQPPPEPAAKKSAKPAPKPVAPSTKQDPKSSNPQSPVLNSPAAEAAVFPTPEAGPLSIAAIAMAAGKAAADASPHKKQNPAAGRAAGIVQSSRAAVANAGKRAPAKTLGLAVDPVRLLNAAERPVAQAAAVVCPF